MLQVKDLSTALNVPTPTANPLIKQMILKGMIVKMTEESRCRIYLFKRYMDLFISEPS